MGLFSLCILGVGLAMDAFAVSVCDGLCCRSLRLKHAVRIALCFGMLQGVMPMLGFWVGTQFSAYITAFDHWVALVLLSALGLRMIAESFHAADDLPESDILTGKTLLLQGIATSVDAMAVGISLAAIGAEIFSAAGVICVLTACISLIGVYVGKLCGVRLNGAARLCGGLLLMLIGLKIFLEDLI